MSSLHCTVCQNALTNQSVKCVGCQASAHSACIGLNTADKVVGHIEWSCPDCGTCKRDLFRVIDELRQELFSIKTMAQDVHELKSELLSLKQYREPSSIIEKNKTNYAGAAKFNLNSSAFIRNARESVSSEAGSSRVTKRKGSKDRNDRRPKKPLITGEVVTEALKGVEKPPPRRHLYVGRIKQTNDESDIVAWCQSKGFPLNHIREITKENSRHKSFHCVFDGEHATIIDQPNSWPENVVINRYYLDAEARTWLRTLKSD